METIKAIHSRNSISNLIDPYPNKEEMELVYKSALRAPDHAWLRPWRFIQVTGDSRSKLSNAFLKTYKELGHDLSDELMKKIKKAPFRAPMVLVLIAEVKEHPKVPAIEQMLSTGSAAQNILITLHDMGYGAIWRTGKMSFNQYIAEALGLSKVSQVIGYLYIGTPDPDGRIKKLPDLDSNDYVSYWT